MVCAATHVVCVATHMVYRKEAVSLAFSRFPSPFVFSLAFSCFDSVHVPWQLFSRSFTFSKEIAFCFHVVLRFQKRSRFPFLAKTGFF